MARQADLLNAHAKTSSVAGAMALNPASWSGNTFPKSARSDWSGKRGRPMFPILSTHNYHIDCSIREYNIWGKEAFQF